MLCDKHAIYGQLIPLLLEGPAGCGWVLYDMDYDDVSLFLVLLLILVFAKIKVLKQLLRSVLQAGTNIWGIIFPTIKLNTRVSSMVLITLMSMESSAVKYIFGEIRL